MKQSDSFLDSDAFILDPLCIGTILEMPNLHGAKLCIIIQVNKNEIHSYNNGVP